MPPFNPIDVVFPKNRIRRVIRVLHDGTTTPPNDFSIAELEPHDGTTCFDLRQKTNDWNEDNPNLVYPTCRPGNPICSILPDSDNLLQVMNRVF